MDIKPFIVGDKIVGFTLKLDDDSGPSDPGCRVVLVGGPFDGSKVIADRLTDRLYAFRCPYCSDCHVVCQRSEVDGIVGEFAEYERDPDDSADASIHRYLYAEDAISFDPLVDRELVTA